MSIEEGKAAPLFTLPDADNQKFAMREQRGRYAIVYFYPRDNTPGCTKEAVAFRDLYPEFQKRDTVVIGISPDTPESHQRFRDQHQIPFPLLSDTTKKVMIKYGAWGEKTMYGRKTVGVIRSTVLLDPKGKVIKHWRRVGRAAEHPAHALKALDAALARAKAAAS